MRSIAPAGSRRIGGEGVPGMTQIVEVDDRQADLGNGGQPRAAVEVAMPQRASGVGWSRQWLRRESLNRGWSQERFCRELARLSVELGVDAILDIDHWGIRS
jgi:hypothetical protein